MAVARVVQVTLRGSQEGQTYRNVLNFGGDPAGFDANQQAILLALAAAVFECFMTTLMSRLPNEFRLDEVGAKQIFPAVTDEATDVSLAGFGTIGTGTMPTFCSQLLHIKTGGGGRRGRGRIFLPAPVEVNTAGNLINSDGMDAITDFAVCMVGKFVGASKTEPWALGVLSRRNAAVAGQTLGTSFREAVALVPSNQIAIMSRRKVGRGN